MDTSALEARLAFAHELADAAAAVVRRGFRRTLEVARKPDGSPVTAVDREAERAMRALIAERHPEHGVLGEEEPPSRPEARELWVIDPIDGTRAFLAGVAVFGTLVALVRDGAPVVGLIDQPITGERWVGARGRPTTFNGRAVRTRPCPRLSEAVLCTSSPHYFEGEEHVAYERLRRAVGWPLYGADCYGFGLLAAGLVDIAVETGLDSHDFCALVPVVEGAGGTITDWRGAALTLHGEGRVLAAGDGAIHGAALARLEG